MAERRPKIDLQRAQRMLRRAMVRTVKECLDPHDPATFIVIVLASLSAVIAETAGSGLITTPGGIDRIVKFAISEFAHLLREDLQQRLEHQLRQARH